MKNKLIGILLILVLLLSTVGHASIDYSLSDLYIWNNMLIYLETDNNSVALAGLFDGGELPDNLELNIPEQIGRRFVTRILEKSFSKHEKLIRVNIPSTVLVIEDHAFYQNSNLNEVTLSDGVQRIGRNFSQCPQLTQVYVPASVTEIAEGSFVGNDPLFNMIVEKGSYAEEYAKDHSIQYRYASQLGAGVEVEAGNIVEFGEMNGKPIEWYVLGATEESALLFSKDILCSRRFSALDDSKWHNSEIRAYLNDTLYREIFDSEDAGLIVTQNLSNPASPYDLLGLPQPPTYDRVFLLSYREANNYLTSDEMRTASDGWWLRTAYDYSNYSHYVGSDGDLEHWKENDNTLGVRPAVWIQLEHAGNAVKLIDDANLTPDAEVEDDAFGVGDMMILGSYEQNNDKSDGSEPLEWRVLSIDGTTATLITKYGVDVREYHDSDQSVNWKNTALREWLNNGFLNTAFTAEEQDSLIRTSVANYNTDAAASGFYGYSYNIEPVRSDDLVWILEYDEANRYLPDTEDKLAYPTKYAAAKGVNTNNEGYAQWLLRSDKNNRNRVDIMFPYRGGLSISLPGYNSAVRPVVKVDLVKLGYMEPIVEEKEVEAREDSDSIAPRVKGPGEITNLNDGDVVNGDQDIEVKWNLVNGAGKYYVMVYPANGSDEERIWGEEIWSDDGTYSIPGGTLAPNEYRIDVEAWEGSGAHGDYEMSCHSVKVKVQEGTYPASEDIYVENLQKENEELNRAVLRRSKYYLGLLESLDKTSVSAEGVPGVWVLENSQTAGRKLQLCLHPDGRAELRQVLLTDDPRNYSYAEELSFGWNMMENGISLYYIDEDGSATLSFETDFIWENDTLRTEDGFAMCREVDLSGWNGNFTDYLRLVDYAQSGYVGIWKTDNLVKDGSEYYYIYLSSNGRAKLRILPTFPEREIDMSWEPTDEGFQFAPDQDSSEIPLQADKWCLVKVEPESDWCSWYAPCGVRTNLTRISDIWTEEGMSNTIVEYQVNEDGEAILTKFLSIEEELMIPESIDGIKVVAIADGLFKGNAVIKKVMIPGNVRSIGEDAFADCIRLEEVELCEGVKNIGANAFEACTLLKNVEFPESLETIGTGTFSKCRNLTAIKIPGSVHTISPNSFFGCDHLTTLEICEGTQVIGESAFEGCSALKSLLIPESIREIGSYAFRNGSYDRKIEINGYAEKDSAKDSHAGMTDAVEAAKPAEVSPASDFEYSISDGKITITAYKGVGGDVIIPETIEGCPVTSIGDRAFYSSDLDSVTLPSTLTSIGNSAFEWCNGLNSITLPFGVTNVGPGVFAFSSGLESIGDCAFRFCSMKSITIPSSVTSIGDGAFEYCDDLNSITIPASVTSIGNCAFNGCSELESINVDEANNDYCIQDGVLFNKSKTALIVYPAKKAGSSYRIPDGVVSIEEAAFDNCKNLESITLPSGVTSIGSYAFDSCEKLESITIPSGVTSIGSYAFMYCSSLKNISIPATVTDIEHDIFCYCENLENIDVDTSNCNYCIMDGVLFNKDKTALIAYPAGKAGDTYNIPDEVKHIASRAFGNCSSLEHITIPSSVTYIGFGAFERCSSLKSIAIPSGVTRIERFTFAYCESLEHITIPSSVVHIESDEFEIMYGEVSSTIVIYGVPGSYAESYAKEYNINFKAIQEEQGSAAFESASPASFASDYAYSISDGQVTITGYEGSNSDIVVPGEIEGKPVVCIGETAFSDCANIESIEIPDSVTSIGDSAFADCKGLKSISIPAGVTSMGSSVFDGCEDITIIADESSYAFAWIAENGYLRDEVFHETITFGSYEQDNNTSNGKEPIEWIILDRNETGILLLAQKALECQRYNAQGSVTWAESDLRKWLNEDFLNSAFDENERSQILLSSISTPNNPRFDTYGCAATKDYVFLPSLGEMEEYFVNAGRSLEYELSAYCEAGRQANLGYWGGAKAGNEYVCWLRTPGNGSSVVASVVSAHDKPMELGYYGDYSHKRHGLVRPAIWLNNAVDFDLEEMQFLPLEDAGDPVEPQMIQFFPFEEASTQNKTEEVEDLPVLTFGTKDSIRSDQTAESAEIPKISFSMLPTAAPAATEEPVQQAYTLATVTGVKVNIRSGPGKKYDKIDSLTEGFTAEYTGESGKDSDGVVWYKISYSGRMGWISSKYIDLTEISGGEEKASENEPKEKTYQAIVKGRKVNVRSGPGKENKKIDSLAQGFVAEYTGESKKDSDNIAWYKIFYNGKIGWIASTQVDLIEIS